MIVGTFGVNLDLNVNADLTGATSAKIIIKSPKGRRTEATASIQDAANGIVRYVTEAGVFNKIGDYDIQAWVYFDTSKLLKSESVTLEVTESL